MVTTRGPAAFPPAERIRRRQDFKKIHEEGRRTSGRYMTALFLANTLGHGRLGIIASRRLGGAVARNRAKRLIREVFRRSVPPAIGMDVVVIPRRELFDAAFADFEADPRKCRDDLVDGELGHAPGAVAELHGKPPLLSQLFFLSELRTSRQG